MEIPNFNIRDFNEEEKKEISHYIQSNTTFSILQRLLIITDNPSDKGEVFIACYRLLNTAKNLASISETAAKLQKLLDSTKDLYDQLYPLLVRFKSSSEFMKYQISNKIITILSDCDNKIAMNNLIDVFLILAEKFELMDINKIPGIDMDTKEGENLYAELVDNKTISQQ